MAHHMVEGAEKVWETWNIRVCIILSLFLQVCLTVLAPFRKSNKNLSFFIWIVYLLADSIALYTIGLISNTSITTTTSNILVFWSPFLLVHLGGPDTITALALEDNELWLRHLLQLGTQSAGTIYLFYRTFRTKSGNELLIPAVIMYVNGCVKYFERITSLYLASMDTYRESLTGKPNAGPNYAALMEEYSSRKDANIPVDIESNLDDRKETDDEVGHQNLGAEEIQNAVEDQNSVDNIEETKLVKQAHEFYVKFRGLIADTIFTLKERTESRQFFLADKPSGVKAFKVIQIELNFIYDVFFTKVNMLQKAHGTTHVFSIVVIIVSALLFYLKNTQNYKIADLYITYVLLGGAFIMELISVVMLCLSDWAIVFAMESSKKCFKDVYSAILELSLRYSPRRWSEEISQYNLFYYCLNDHSTLTNILLLKRIKDAAVNFFYVRSKPYEDDLGNLIFEELKIKARDLKDSKDAKKACDARGNLLGFPEFQNESKTLLPWTLRVDYDESLVLWHIATHLCDNTNVADTTSKFCKYSKILGNYMMYLMVMKPSMTSSVAGIAHVRIQDTCEEAKLFIRRKLPREEIGKLAKMNRLFKYLFQVLVQYFLWLLYYQVRNLIYYCVQKKDSHEVAKETKTSSLNDSRIPGLCKKFMNIKTERKPVAVKGDGSKSVMFDACILAHTLNNIGEFESCRERQWEVTFKVWVELLCYAACRSKPTAHVAQLREGGELITLVWLLMAHLGLAEQFRTDKGTGWAKLIVHK